MNVKEVMKLATQDFGDNDIAGIIKDNLIDGSTTIPDLIRTEARDAADGVIAYYEEAFELWNDFRRNNPGINFDQNTIQASDEIMELITHTAIGICEAIYYHVFIENAKDLGILR